jgi:hypothetical protein
MAVESDIAVIETADTNRGSYVDWPAIIAGIVLASAISILFLTFGSAVGLSFADFDARPDVSPIWVAVAAAAWLLWVQISSFMAGGYLTGRLRKRHADATEDEVDIRDGSHGLLVWAGALVVGALLAVSGIGAAATAVGSAAATITTAAAEGADGPAGALDPNAYFVDMLFRAPPAEPAGETTAAEAPAAAPATEAPAAETPAAPATTTEAPAAGTEAPAATTTTEAPAATTTTTPTTTAPAPAATTAPPAVEAAPGRATTETQVVRDEVGRIFARGATTDGVSADDRVYLAQLVAENTGLSDEEATARVDQVMSAMDAAADEAAEAAETARKTAVIAAFLTAASFLVSAVGAWWAAQMGGNHRDNNVVFPGAFRRL